MVNDSPLVTAREELRPVSPATSFPFSENEKVAPLPSSAGWRAEAGPNAARAQEVPQ